MTAPTWLPTATDPSGPEWWADAPPSPPVDGPLPSTEIPRRHHRGIGPDRGVRRHSTRRLRQRSPSRQAGWGRYPTSSPTRCSAPSVPGVTSRRRRCRPRAGPARESARRHRRTTQSVPGRRAAVRRSRRCRRLHGAAVGGFSSPCVVGVRGARRGRHADGERRRRDRHPHEPTGRRNQRRDPGTRRLRRRTCRLPASSELR